MRRSACLEPSSFLLEWRQLIFLGKIEKQTLTAPEGVSILIKS